MYFLFRKYTQTLTDTVDTAGTADTAYREWLSCLIAIQRLNDKLKRNYFNFI